METQRGLRCSILVNKEFPNNNFSNNGISQFVSQVTLVGPGVPAIHLVSDDAPAVVLVRRNILGETYTHAKPLHNAPDGAVGPMAGGAFIYTNDSRFREVVGTMYPVSLHDRYETVEQYRRHSI